MSQSTPSADRSTRWPGRLAAAPRRLLLSSLPLRIVAAILGACVVVLALGGILLFNQTTLGVLEGKKQASAAEAASALRRMQQSLAATDLRTASFYDRLSRLADEAGAQASQYLIIIEGPVAGFVSPGITVDTVPASLRTAVQEGTGLYQAPTMVRYWTAGVTDEPGLVVGGKLQAPGSAVEVPIYFIFPLTREVQILSVVRGALLTTGAVLMAALGLVSLVVARRVAGPIRAASTVAERLAGGHLDERIPVRGTDALASLGTSMNHMADELQAQITQLEDLSRVQRRFVSDVSHELRTPLTTVRMAAEVLYESRPEMPAEAARSTELLHAELDRFEALLSDLLEISRFDAGAAVLTTEDVDLGVLAERAVEAVRPFADTLDTRILVSVPRPAVAEVDPKRVGRVLRNLLTNAVEHGERGLIEVSVRCNNTAVAVGVRDHGVGLGPGHAERAFARFWRADPSRARTLGGSGLGLAIALEDARLHGGTLQAWGEPGDGANFVLTLPRRPGQEMRGHPVPLIPMDARARKESAS